jgi:hypothetical protein
MDELPPTTTSAFSSILHRHDIPHYYGDYVRELFVAAAALTAVAIPVWGDLLPIGTSLQVAAALLLVILAGLTNPHGKIIMLYNATVATIGVFLFEVTAITYYSEQPFVLFTIRETAAILLLFAMYFSIKTMRAMSLGKLGKPDMPIDLEDSQ